MMNTAKQCTEISVIGSDETGKGEIFRQMIATAAYVKPENIRGLEKLHVKDSKKMKQEQIRKTGRELTGIASYSDFKGREGTVIKMELVTFCIGVLTNREYNEQQGTTDGSVDADILLERLHRDAIHTLSQEIEKETGKYDIVVDDFLSGNGKDEKRMKFKESFHLPGNKQIRLETEADANVMAVSCASVISKYLELLYIDELLEEHNLTEADIPKTGGITPEEFDSLCKKLKDDGKDPELFFKHYAKKFKNVQKLLKEKS